MTSRPLVVVLLLAAAACTDVIIPPDRPTPAPPTAPTPAPVTPAKIEFRVVGNATSVRVRISNPQDGLSQTVTTLPYFVVIRTSESPIFLSLEVTPLSYSLLTTVPFLSAQIVVDGLLFREATSAEFLLNTLSVSGTWRRE